MRDMKEIGKVEDIVEDIWNIINQEVSELSKDWLRYHQNDDENSKEIWGSNNEMQETVMKWAITIIKGNTRENVLSGLLDLIREGVGKPDFDVNGTDW